MTKAMEGKFESVKLLIKMAEEEKGKKSERIREEEPSLKDMLIGSNVKIGQVWDGYRWKRLSKKKILEATVVEEVEEAVVEGKDDSEEAAPRRWNVDESFAAIVRAARSSRPFVDDGSEGAVGWSVGDNPGGLLEEASRLMYAPSEGGWIVHILLGCPLGDSRARTDRLHRITASV